MTKKIRKILTAVVFILLTGLVFAELELDANILKSSTPLGNVTTIMPATCANCTNITWLTYPVNIGDNLTINASFRNTRVNEFKANLNIRLIDADILTDNFLLYASEEKHVLYNWTVMPGVGCGENSLIVSASGGGNFPLKKIHLSISGKKYAMTLEPDTPDVDDEIKVTVKDEDGKDVNGAKISVSAVLKTEDGYTEENAGVAYVYTVNGSAKILINKPGTYRITAEYEKEGYCKSSYIERKILNGFTIHGFKTAYGLEDEFNVRAEDKNKKPVTLWVFFDGPIKKDYFQSDIPFQFQEKKFPVGTYDVYFKEKCTRLECNTTKPSLYGEIHKEITLSPGRTDSNSYLFVWDDVPGINSSRIVSFLENDMNVWWAQNAEINKSDDNKTITISCLADRCPRVCGDGKCEGIEKCSNCEKDCGACIVCGDGICNGNETCETCGKDCGNCIFCGDGKCGVSETYQTCPRDCSPACGNGECAGNETYLTCTGDCSPACGNGECGGNETYLTCPMDCPPVCGDEKCEGNETCVTCEKDCSNCICGNGKCEGENYKTCPEDCSSVCGNGKCEGSETCVTCPDDCITVTGRKNLLIFKLNKEDGKVNLKICGKEIYQYISKEENGKLRIYSKSTSPAKNNNIDINNNPNNNPNNNSNNPNNNNSGNISISENTVTGKEEDGEKLSEAEKLEIARIRELYNKSRVNKTVTLEEKNGLLGGTNYKTILIFIIAAAVLAGSIIWLWKVYGGYKSISLTLLRKRAGIEKERNLITAHQANPVYADGAVDMLQGGSNTGTDEGLSVEEKARLYIREGSNTGTDQEDNSGTGNNFYGSFDWNDIPGKESGRFLKFLKNEMKINWAENASIKKSDDGKAITVSNGSESLVFRVDN